MAIQLNKVKSAVRKSIADTTGKAVSMSDVDRLVNERTAGVRAESARGAYAMANMADLPEIYRGQLPATEDPEALAAAEHEIRSAYRADLKVHGPFQNGYSSVIGNPSDAGPPTSSTYYDMGRAQALAEQQRAAGEKPAETPPPAPPDLDKMSVSQLFALGLRQQEAGNNSGTQQQLVQSRPSTIQTMPPNYVGMSSSALISLGLRGLK